MTQTPRGSLERLLNVEQVTPSLKQRYDEEIQAMLEQKLTGFRRWSWLVAAVGGLASAVLFAALAVLMPAGFPWMGRLAFAGGVVFGIVWSVVGFRVFRRGALSLKTDTAAVAALSWCLPVFLATIFMVSAPNNIVGLRMILSSLAFLVIGAVFLIVHVIQQWELRSREKLLEIEYRLAELAEAITPDRPLPPAREV